MVDGYLKIKTKLDNKDIDKGVTELENKILGIWKSILSINEISIEDLLEKVKRMCDIIIIDGTPCQLVAYSLIISGIVENTIIVTASEETKKDGLKRIVTNIENIGGKISGIVLNKVPIVSKDYQETYYYSSHKTKK